MAIESTLQTIGQISGIVELISGIFFAVVFIVVGIILIIQKKNVGLGILLIVIAFIIAGASYFYYWLVQNNPNFAAFAGIMAFTGGGLTIKQRIANKMKSKIEAPTIT